MSRNSRSVHASMPRVPQRPPQQPRAGAPIGRPALRKVAAGGGLLVLTILLWLTAYQNIPTTLHGMTIKPIDTAGAIDKIVKVSAILVGIGIIAARWSQARVLATNVNVGLVAFMVVIPLSALWSIDSDATLRRFTSLAAIVVICLGISLVGRDPQRFQKVALPPLLFILLVSLVFGAVYPDKVIEVGQDISQKGSWHGITYQKNQFGMTASVVALILLNQLLARAGNAFWLLAGLGAALACLILSRSSTSLLATMLGTAFMVLVMRVPVVKKRYTTHVVVGIAATILMYELAVQNVIPGSHFLLEPFTTLTGKDMTFSARSIIWETVKEHIRAAPWLGTGYGAYWPALASPSSPSYIFVYTMFFYPAESHNGYLEIMNDLGRLGLACLMVYLVYYIKQALQLMRYDRSRAALYLVVLFQQMVANLSESEWFSRSTICIVLLLATVCMSRDLSEYRLPQPAKAAGRSRRSSRPRPP